jgi:hypothetical protein
VPHVKKLDDRFGDFRLLDPPRNEPRFQAIERELKASAVAKVTAAE